MTASWAVERRLVRAAPPRKAACRSRCLQPLSCVLVALRSASPAVAALPHALASMSAYLDYSPRFSIPRACSRAPRSAKLHLLERLYDAQCAAERNPLYQQWAFARGATNAAKRGDLRVVQWLCAVFYPQGRVTDAVEAAAQAGHVQILQWLYEHHASVFWGANEMRAAARFDRVVVVKWLHAHTAPPLVGMNAIELAARNGNLQLVKWLHKTRGRARSMKPLPMDI
ncbi:Secreted RxLR effector protein 124 [Phytophthora ramorum]|uniref:Secreted RxLR effector protein 124 n=1 Tax=Phytophthora ramorum TaxID=164328 RepID=UPI0030ACF941|nr:Secreted RxLR effector protein 124 [Phytophthora ramorum]